MEIVRRGSEGHAVRRWQHFLLGRRLLSGVDGVFGPLTEAATKAFQRSRHVTVDGVVGPQTLAAALRAGFDLGFTDPLGGTSGPSWPPPPVFRPLVSNIERAAIFGTFAFERKAAGKDDIRMLDNWEAKHIVSIVVPQLAGIDGAAKSARIRVHRLVAEQIQTLFQAWDAAGLCDRIRTWAGSFVPRFVRGSSSTLSNHAWGTAFDINVEWNARGTVPALRGEKGSVRELVPLANDHGFYWGGHFERRDGMHFEVARVLS